VFLTRHRAIHRRIEAAWTSGTAIVDDIPGAITLTHPRDSPVEDLDTRCLRPCSLLAGQRDYS
jgi:hypothetical protein